MSFGFHIEIPSLLSKSTSSIFRTDLAQRIEVIVLAVDKNSPTESETISL
jgi:hypothetical protein